MIIIMNYYLLVYQKDSTRLIDCVFIYLFLQSFVSAPH